MPMEITAPNIEYGLLAAVHADLRRRLPRGAGRGLRAPRAADAVAQLVVTFAAIAARVVHDLAELGVPAPTAVAAVGSVALDGPTYFMWAILLIFGAISFLMFAERKSRTGQRLRPAGRGGARHARPSGRRSAAGVEHTEVFPLALFALSGMMLFPASNDLITMFVALEILSLPLYLLCGLARRRRLLSQEAALKYFLLGALSSAFFLYGAALLYGYAGSFDLVGDRRRAADQHAGLRAAARRDGPARGRAAVQVRRRAVPLLDPGRVRGRADPGHRLHGGLHQDRRHRRPDAGVLRRRSARDRWDWQPLMAIVAVATMAVGSVLAITQTDVKRMLAYSSIAHAGFLMTAFVGASQAVTGSQPGSLTSVSSVMFYLVAYGAATLGAFAMITMVRDPSGEATLLTSWVGLGRRSPLAAVVFSIFMLSFAGIPLTSGFIGKWAVFAAAWSGGAQWLVVVAVVISVVAAFFYIRVIVLMFFSEPTDRYRCR